MNTRKIFGFHLFKKWVCLQMYENKLIFALWVQTKKGYKVFAIDLKRVLRI